MKRGQILIPNDLCEKEIQLILNIIEEIEINNPEVKKDYILVDKIYGDINIKIFNYDKIEMICQNTGSTVYDICMEFLARQNKTTKEPTKIFSVYN
ncbi:MAG: hypothetical protein KGZ85_01585 [Ignavibacterium sp.]|nr:hypothetical protein [Ignavibacterium sp.]